MNKIHCHSRSVLLVGAEYQIFRLVPTLKKFAASVYGTPILPPIILRCGVPFLVFARYIAAARSRPVCWLGGDHEHEEQEIQPTADCGTPPGLSQPRLHVSHPRKS